MMGRFASQDQPAIDKSDDAANGHSTSSDDSEQVNSNFDLESLQSSTSSVPPRAAEWDRTLRHVGLAEFGKSLEKAARAVYPNDKKSRYSKTYVLLICWKTQDPKLPVEREIIELRQVFEEVYHYEIEEFWIPNSDSHGAVSEKINAFVKVNDNSSDDLKIVYYAGHSRLSRTKELLWSTLPDRNGKCPVVVWSGIQRSLEMAQSDILILLDCCSSGVANASEGNGVTELICASPFDTRANGVGHYSFTRALITELRLLSKKPCISVGELYTYIYTRIQSYLPQGVENERYPAPIHLVLTDGDPFTRGIKLSVQVRKDSDKCFEEGHTKRELLEDEEVLNGTTENRSSHSPRKRFCLDGTSVRLDVSDFFEEEDGAEETGSSSQEERKAGSAHHGKKSDEDLPGTFTASDSLLQDAPRALFVVRFREDVRGEDLSVELFREWLRSIPAAAEEVRVEAFFKCFSTLILITVPIAMCSYIPQNHAVFLLGAVKSPIMLPKDAQQPSFHDSEERTEGLLTKHSPVPWKPTAKLSQNAPMIKPELSLDIKLNILKYLPPYPVQTAQPEVFSESLSDPPVPTSLSSVTSMTEPEPLRDTSSTTVKPFLHPASSFALTPHSKPLKARRPSRPKVKSGCNNCKNRRVKCDETRPQCQKCVRSGRMCDGYPVYKRSEDKVPRAFPTPPASTVSSSSPSVTSSLVSKRRTMKTPNTLQSPRPLTHVIPTLGLFDAQEGQYFQVFCTHAASELSGYFDSEFWTRTVLQESHYESSIRHAIVALGALYKSLGSAQNENDIPFDSAPDHYSFALQQYGKAIRRLRESLTNNETRSIRTVLISIILFICFQSLTGDYKAAISQLQHGLGLLQERVHERTQDFRRIDEVEDELVHTFKRLAVQAKFCGMLLHLPPPFVIRLSTAQEPTSSQSPLSPPETVDTPSLSPGTDVPELFLTSLEARSSLNAICEHTIRLIEQASPNSFGNVGVLQLDQWSIGFVPLLEGRRRPGVKVEERTAINSLKMIQLMAYVLFLSSLKAWETYASKFQSYFKEIVELGKEVIVDEELSFAQMRAKGGYNSTGNTIPSFTSEMCLIAPLFIVATQCRNRKTRREAIRLLLSRPRREGLWDGMFCARFSEQVMEIEEEGMSLFDSWNQSASEQVPDGKRVVIKEIVFDLQGRKGMLKYGTKDMGSEIVEVDISW